jgi:hypothetical protein
VVERQLPKLYVVGSIPIARSKISGSYFSDLAKFGTVAPSIFMPHMLQICRKHYQPLTRGAGGSMQHDCDMRSVSKGVSHDQSSRASDQLQRR